jgi:hypothetical protein
MTLQRKLERNQFLTDKRKPKEDEIITENPTKND